MKYSGSIIAIVFLLSGFVCAQTPIGGLEGAINTLGAALKNKDIALAGKTFAPDFSISTGTWPAAKSLLNTILENLKFESVEFDMADIQEGADTTFVKVKFILAEGQPQESVVAFDKEKRILFIDYFDRLFGHSRYRKPRLAGTLPFISKGGSIVLEIKLNNDGRSLLFLLDTGADGMAITKELADSLKLEIDCVQDANVVGGQAWVSISSGNTVHLSDSMSLSNQKIAIFEKVRHDLDGIIGLNLVKQYITGIDFDNRLIRLYSFGDYRYASESKIIKVSTPYNLILAPATLNLTGKKEVTGHFLVDTGANYHLIAFSDFVRKNRLLLSGFKPESQSATVSLGHVTPVYNGKAFGFSLAGGITQSDMPVTLQASNGKAAAGNTPDGSIGIQFWSKYNLIIDLLKKEIHLLPRNSVWPESCFLHANDAD
ncbi:MAG: retroviral-like aspartic protease family protein [Prevotella sp.]|jgi:predicted aspartyl protease|nr:retroviral-like aspartic protease family protein [Prevotella sp.]